MQLDTKIILKALSPKLVSKTMATLDRNALLLSGVAWLTMIVTMSLTIYTLHLATTAQRAATAEMVAEPHLPKTVRKGLDAKEVQTLIDRMKRLYPGLEFSQSTGKSLTVSSNDGAKFREWLTAISYVDAATPQFHWSLQDLCVGKCNGKDLMRATMSGEKISYESPVIK